MILIATYDLKGPAGSYDEFYEVLKQQGPWWHYLRLTWLISTGKNPIEVFREIKPYLHPNDHILISQMGEQYQGWLPKDAWDWIHKHENPQGTYGGLIDADQSRQSSKDTR